jgi:hypothetical protein
MAELGDGYFVRAPMLNRFGEKQDPTFPDGLDVVGFRFVNAPGGIHSGGGLLITRLGTAEDSAGV